VIWNELHVIVGREKQLYFEKFQDETAALARHIGDLVLAGGVVVNRLGVICGVCVQPSLSLCCSGFHHALLLFSFNEIVENVLRQNVS
jgi:hypothetical protein